MNTRYTSTAILLFIIPLLMSPITKEIFELPKTEMLYIIAGSFLVISKGNINITKKSIPYLLILSTTIISTLFSSYTYNSIFGYYTRFNGGLLSIISYVTIVLIISKNINIIQQNFKPITTAIVSVGLLISIYSILQRLGIDKSHWVSDSSLRTFATLGQPNWLAAYLIPVLFISIWKGFVDQKYKYTWTIVSGMIYAGFWFTYSLSGITGFLISYILFILLIKNHIKKHLLYLALTTGIFIIISLGFLGTFEHRLINIKTNFLGSAINKVYAIEYAPKTIKTEDTGNIRLILWKGSIDLIISDTKQFLIGSGPQTFVYSIQKFMPKEMRTTTEATFIHNKPHNWFVELAADLGILGLLSYLFFILFYLFKFIKNIKKMNIKDNDYLLFVSFFVGWLSVIISSFFGWLTVSTMFIFFIWPLFFINTKQNENN